MSSRSMSKNAGRCEKQSLGTWLRQLRRTRKLPLRRVAAAADMDTAHLSKIELGQRLPTPTQASALAAFFGMPPHELEAKRIAEKFWKEHKSNPVATKAVGLLSAQTSPAEKRTKDLSRSAPRINKKK